MSLEVMALRDEPRGLHLGWCPGSVLGSAGSEPFPGAPGTPDSSTSLLSHPQHTGNVNYSETGGSSSKLTLLPP